MKDFKRFVAEQIVDFMQLYYPPNILHEFAVYLGGGGNKTTQQEIGAQIDKEIK